LCFLFLLIQRRLDPPSAAEFLQFGLAEDTTTNFSRADLYDMESEVGAALGFMVVKSENCPGAVGLQLQLRQRGAQTPNLVSHGSLGSEHE